MLGSDRGKIKALITIIDEEMNGAIHDMHEGRNEDAVAKMEYVKRICNNLILLDNTMREHMDDILKEFGEHIEKVSK